MRWLRGRMRSMGEATTPKILVAVLSLGLVALLIAAAPSRVGGSHTNVAVPAAVAPPSGCLLCHANADLWSEEPSQYVAEETISRSVHADIGCTQCHTDFASQSQQSAGTDPRMVAELACQSCHSSQFQEYRESVHGRLAIEGSGKGGATCVDCHGSHAIKRAETLSGQETCANCHESRYEAYADYYHGRPYKLNATDAPAFWDCHGAHDVLPAADTGSRVSQARLPQTCGRCHEDASPSFVAFSRLIHGSQDAHRENIVISTVTALFESLTSVFR